jgi:Fe2+ transport system protein FeoA
MKIMTLDRLLPGEGGFVRGYAEAQDLHYRLKELGLVEGTRVRVRRCAPLGDPMELSIRGYHLSIRRQDAAKILVSRD